MGSPRTLLPSSHEGTWPVKPGDVIDGKYCVERLIGSGAMGFVVAARHLQLEQLVAIKFVLPHVLGNPQIVQRFMREARAAARLRSEHVAHVIDVGSTDAGLPFIVMEYLHGRSLAELLGSEGPLPVPLAVAYVLQACDALIEAHELGIVHRDLKPDNLFVTTAFRSRTVLKVLDFGISKTTAPADPSLTSTSTFMGSPAYMSPEQMRSPRGVDGRADIWSLGIILWEMVAGKVPFIGETFTDLCLRISIDPLPPLPIPPGARDGFEAILRRCLEKDPAERFADVAELVAALTPYAAPPRLPLPPPPPPAPASPALRPRRRHRSLWLGTGAVVLAGGMAAVLAGVSRERAAPIVSPPVVVERLPPPPAPPPEPAAQAQRPAQPPAPAPAIEAAELARDAFMGAIAAVPRAPARARRRALPAVELAEPAATVSTTATSANVAASPKPSQPAPKRPRDPDAPGGDEQP